MSQSANKISDGLAEQRWQIEMQRLRRRQVAIGIGIAACIVAAYPAASAGLKVLAGLCALGALAGLAAVIALLVKSRRHFIDIKMTGGMTREEALSEWTKRYGD
jgi:hypothetical protein